MKRKILSIIAAAVMALALTACGGAAKQVDLKEAYRQGMETILATGMEEPIMLEVTDIDHISAFYTGIEKMELKQLVVYMPPVDGFACEVAMAEAKNAEDAAALAKLFQKRVDIGKESNMYPETTKMWQSNAKVSVNGNYVVMAVLPDGYELPDQFLAKF
mgnify:CR=1 FL=1